MVFNDRPSHHPIAAKPYRKGLPTSPTCPRCGNKSKRKSTRDILTEGQTVVDVLWQCPNCNWVYWHSLALKKISNN